MTKLGLLILLLLFSLYGCDNRNVALTLDAAESSISVSPQKSLELLSEIDSRDIPTRRLKAKYSLLYVSSLEKCRIDTTDLSIILPASRYYSKYGSPEEKAKSYFYQGCIHMNRKEYDDAMHLFQKALEDSSSITSSNIKTLINSTISDLYSRNHNYQQELKYSLDALKYAYNEKDSVGVWAIKGHIATCYANLMNWDLAEKMYQDFFSMKVRDSTTFRKRQLYYAKLCVLKPSPDYQACIDIVERVALSAPEAMSIEAYCVYAYAHQKTGNEVIADRIIEQLKQMGRDSTVIGLWEYRILKSQNNYQSALTKLEQTVEEQNAILMSSLRQSMSLSHRDYLQERNTVLMQKSVIAKQRLLLVILFFVSLLILIILIYIKTKNGMSNRIEELNSLYADAKSILKLQNERVVSYNDKIQEKEATILALRKEFAALYKSSYRVLNDLCSVYFSPIKKNKKEMIYKEVIKQVSLMERDHDSSSKFISIVNESLHNIIDKLRIDFPKYKEQDFLFISYLIVGFEAKTIAMLMGYTVGTVYTKKNRIKVEINILNSSFKELYLEYIN